jgi:O-antigen ligase
MRRLLKAPPTVGKLDRLRTVAAFLVGVTIPISTTLSEIVTGLAFLILLLEWRPRESWLWIRANPVPLAALCLFLLLGIGVLYSVAPLHESTRVLLKYRELLYLPLFLLLCRDQPSARAGLFGFFAAMAVIVALGLYQFAFSMISARPANAHLSLLGSHIAEGVMMALASYYLAVEAISDSRRRKYWASAAALALLYDAFISAGRTGYIVAFCLAVLLLFQTAPRKWLLAGIALIALSAGGLFLISPELRYRMSGVVSSLQGRSDNHASVGVDLRMQFYRGSLALIQRHPIFGTGTGSFEHVYNQQAAANNQVFTSNPHNEYLMIGVQTGLVGVLAFLAFLGTPWIAAARLPRTDAWRGRAVTLALAVSCLFNSSLLDHIDGQSFAFQIGLFFFAAGDHPDGRNDRKVRAP